MPTRALTVALAVLAGCPPPPVAVCGNGVVEAGETEGTCCTDVGCAFGACAPDGRGCAMPWDACAAGSCAGAYACVADGPPSYDCAQCGCPGADACYEGVCYDAATRSSERTDPTVSTSLDLPAYVRFLTDFAAAAAIVAGDNGPVLFADVIAQEVTPAVHADPRHTVLIVGAQQGADVFGVIDGLLSGIGIAPTADLDHPAAPCTDVAAAAAAGLAPDTFVVARVDDEDAGAFTCAYDTTFPRCDLPQTAECVLRAGRIPITVVVVDLKVTLPQMDEQLLLRCGREPQALVGTFLDEAVDRFTAAAAIIPNQGARAIGTRVGETVTVGDGELFVVLADFDAKPFRTGAFRTLWRDATAQQFLVDHALTPRDCAFTVDANTVSIHCAAGGASLDATVDAGDFTLVDVTTVP